MESVEWSGAGAIPAVGTKVNVGLNGLGPGEVTGHYVHDGFIGLVVKIDKEPEWFKKNGGNPAYVFGLELAGGTWGGVSAESRTT